MKTTVLLKEQFERIGLSGFLNKYVIALIVFSVWMLFFDQHNMIVQYRLAKTVKDYQERIVHYEEVARIARQEMHELAVSTEDYARATHRMHKADEEVFIIVND